MMTTTYDEVVPDSPPPADEVRHSPRASRERRTRQRPPLGGFGRAALTGGLLVAAIGVVEMVAWHLHWTDVLRVRDSYAPMVYNTAFALAVTGVAIASSVRGPRRMLRIAGGFDLALGVAMLAENLFGWDLRVDELFMRAYLLGPTGLPGRIPVNVAVCFVVTGSALLIWRPDAKRWRGEALTAAATVVASVAVAALSGYLAGFPVAQDWRSLMALPWPTALAMTFMAASLFALAFATRTQQNVPLSGWIAVPAGAAAFVVTALAWQAFIDMGSAASVSRSDASRAVLFLALLTAGLLALTTWFAQHANRRRQMAEELTVKLRAEVALRAQAEAAARDNEQLLFQFLEAVPAGLLITEPGGRPYFVNRHATTILGRAVVQTEGSQIAEAYHMFVAGTDAPYPMERLPSVRAHAGKHTHIDDMEIRRPDGDIALEWWGTPVLGDTGKVRFGLAAFVDISQRRKIEQTLAQHAALLDIAHDVIYMKDSDSRITFWNRGAEVIYGWTREEAVGQVVYSLLQTEFPMPFESIEVILRRDGQWDGELVQHTKSGERTVVASRFVADLNADGTLATVMAINTDITARKRVEAELARVAVEREELNVELQRSNDELAQFAYIASHDLSEPLRAISGPVSLLARRYQGQLDADADRFIGFAVDGCERMQTLINDLLAFSRVGRVEMTMSPVDTNALVGIVLDALQQTVEGRHAHVTSDDLPPISGDPTQLNQLFQNLIANAIKFTPPDVKPLIHLGAQHQDDHWRFTVTDNGIGIDAHHRERIFGMFKRLHTRDAYPGTGIGLAVCKKIVERHRGTIGVADGPHGRGSTFWFTIPIQ
jgi:PAS domain S-box-containing protein